MEYVNRRYIVRERGVYYKMPPMEYVSKRYIVRERGVYYKIPPMGCSRKIELKLKLSMHYY